MSNSKPSNVILGVDPGLATTGYGLIEVRDNRFLHLDHGTIRTKPDVETGARLSHIYDTMRAILKDYRPTMAGIEGLYFAKNITSAIPVAQARGVLLLAFAQENIRTGEFPPLEIKQAITGNGRAEKHQVQELVRVFLGLKEVPSPDHAADALAIAICCFNTLTARARITANQKGI